MTLVLRFALVDKGLLTVALTPTVAIKFVACLGRLARAVGWTDELKKPPGYEGPPTEKQRQWEEIIGRNTPPIPMNSDLENALKVVAVAGSGSSYSFQLTFRLEDDSTISLQINTVMAAVLMSIILEASEQNDWMAAHGEIATPMKRTNLN